jgi:hypothetical protein
MNLIIMIIFLIAFSGMILIVIILFVILVTAGAIITVNTGDNLNEKIQSANNNDTVMISAGNYNIFTILFCLYIYFDYINILLLESVFLIQLQ